jgi:DNA polymerase-1
MEEWDHPMVREGLQPFRMLDKLYGTYLVGMVAKLARDGRLRTNLKRIGARTGRLSSSDPNLQNIPVRTELGSQIRSAFVATGVAASTYTVLANYVDNKKPAIITVEGEGGGYRVEYGKVVEWWGEKPPYVMFVGDYSQLEICLLAHVSGDKVMIDAVTNGEDIHALTAQRASTRFPTTSR